MAYASYTSTKRNLAMLRREGWGVVLSPATRLKSFGLPYALDNGAWSAFTAGVDFDFDIFKAAVEKIGAGADFVTAPDIVEGGLESLRRSTEWLEWLVPRAKIVAIAVQDGMKPADVAPLLSASVGIFVGGSTRFKEDTLAAWGSLAAAKGCICHVGRVNSARRIALCAAAGATSFDGSSVSRYAKTMPRLENARRQPDLFRRER